MVSTQTDIVILTSKTLPEPHEDDLLLASALEKEGLRTQLRNWEEFDIAKDPTHSVLFRSTWGYFEKIKEFKNFLKTIDRSSCLSWNSVSQIRWNLHKKYLLELAKKSIPVVRTKLIETDQMIDLRAIAESMETQSFVIKPAINAGGYNTLHIDLGSNFADAVDQIKSKNLGSLLVQPFIPSIANEGEYSLIFIDGQLSHSVLKRPQSGEFRIQEQHGGTTEKCATPPEALRLAKQIFACLDEEPFYARVDLARIEGSHFLLMELELIEPHLWMTLEPNSCQLFVNAITKNL